MNIETKYKVGDDVFTVDPKTLKVKEVEVAMITTSTTDSGTSVTLYPKRGDYGYGEGINESICFPSKEQLIDHITKP